MDRVDLFRIFTRVAEAGSFTHAAHTLGLPRSSVSAAVQELEARLGTRLLNRTTRRVALTADGEALYTRAQNLLADFEETEGLFRQSGATPSGRIRIDLPGRVGRLIVAPALPEFLAAYPGIDIELGVRDRAVDLVEDGIDCALRVGPLADSGLIARRLGELELINAASPAYLAAHGIPETPADLDQHHAVAYASPTTGRVEPWEWNGNGQVLTHSLRARLTVNSAEALIAGALAGLGLIQIPAYDVADHIAEGALVEVMPEHRAEPLPVSLVYPHRRQLSHRLRAFLDWLVPVLEQGLRLR
jgi:LysR family transcriptional regulator for bpeEF and oprC